MKELAIGEEICIRCVQTSEAIPCKGCIFNLCCGRFFTKCSYLYRADRKSVHFEIVRINYIST